MRAVDVNPDTTSFNTAISACEKDGVVEVGSGGGGLLGQNLYCVGHLPKKLSFAQDH